MQRGEVAVIGIEAEHARPSIAVERLEDDVAMFGLEVPQNADIPRDGRGRREIGEIEDQELFGRVAHPEGIVDDERSALEPVQNVGRRDVTHIEGRVLAQPDDIDIAKVQIDGLAQIRVTALDALHRQRLRPGDDAPFAEGQAIGGVVPQGAVARLRLLGQPERAVGIDVDGPDRIHLERNFHDLSPAPEPALKMARATGERNGRSGAERVLDQVHPARAVDKGHVEAHRRHEAARQLSDVCFRASQEALDLTAPQGLGRLCM